MNKKWFYSVFLGLLCGALWFGYQEFQSEELPGNPSAWNFSESNYPMVETESRSSSADSELEALPSAVPRPSQNEPIADIALSPEDQKRWGVVEELLKSKNDNDPRFDSELSQLSPELKKQIYARYAQLPEESRNERGTLVYLAARDIQYPEDLQFIESIYQEEPCKSLADCRHTGDVDLHMEAVNQTSLDYPQKVGLYLLEKNLAKNPQMLTDEKLRKEVQRILLSALRFPISSVQNQAKNIIQKYKIKL